MAVEIKTAGGTATDDICKLCDTPVAPDDVYGNSSKYMVCNNCKEQRPWHMWCLVNFKEKTKYTTVACPACNHVMFHVGTVRKEDIPDAQAALNKTAESVGNVARLRIAKSGIATADAILVTAVCAFSLNVLRSGLGAGLVAFCMCLSVVAGILSVGWTLSHYPINLSSAAYEAWRAASKYRSLSRFWNHMSLLSFFMAGINVGCAIWIACVGGPVGIYYVSAFLTAVIPFACTVIAIIADKPSDTSDSWETQAWYYSCVAHCKCQFNTLVSRRNVLYESEKVKDRPPLDVIKCNKELMAIRDALASLNGVLCDANYVTEHPEFHFVL